MTPRSRQTTVLAALLFAMSGAACGGNGESPGSAAQSSSAAQPSAPAAQAVATVMQAALVCQPSGAHDAHTAITSCETCHACPGTTSFDVPVTMPGGTSTAGGVVTRGTPTTCTVACHYPFGGEPRAVEWRPGALMCSSCHSAVGSGSLVTSHPVDLSGVDANRASCQNCHNLGTHLSGQVSIDLGNGTSVVVDSSGASSAINPACEACHDGAGKTLASKVPIIVNGWNSPTGDFHGSRQGLATGYGGTLRAPFQRRQAALACTACHDAHGSPTQYLFAREVNGIPVLGTITDQGVGAEALCNACHQGERHQRCKDCHASAGVCGYDDPSYVICAGGLAVDPAPVGSACFQCHGHEGVTQFPTAQYPTGHPDGQDVSCTHCHARWGGGSWYAALDTTAPTLVGGVGLQDVTGTSAVVKWTTNEPTTGWVELQDGEVGKVLGSGALATSHTVTVSGLTAGRSYPFRVRSADRFRNVLLTATAQLETISANGPPAPTLIDQPDTIHWGTVPLTLQWQPVTSPAGNPVQYRVQIDYRNPAYAPAIYESAWASGTSHAVSLYVADWPYYWRVQARDAVTGAISTWSASDSVWLCPDWLCSE